MVATVPKGVYAMKDENRPFPEKLKGGCTFWYICPYNERSSPTRTGTLRMRTLLPCLSVPRIYEAAKHTTIPSPMVPSLRNLFMEVQL